MAGGSKIFDDAEVRRKLTPEQYRVLRAQGTERPFTGKYWNEHAQERSLDINNQ